MTLVVDAPSFDEALARAQDLDSCSYDLSSLGRLGIRIDELGFGDPEIEPTEPHEPDEVALAEQTRSAAEDDLMEYGLASVLARHGKQAPPSSGESINNWATLVSWTDGPVEFAGVVSQVVDHDDGALAQLHRFLEYAENRLWERHDNDRATKFAEARKLLEEIGDDLARTATEMLTPPSRPRQAAVVRSNRLPALTRNAPNTPLAAQQTTLVPPAAASNQHTR
ncbi:hypothetical protein [Kitasatospora sp. GAS1066B]|uniref:hypothetical protein n=1 Tax=Kitasatospora sp. GAS1066B TaxID=3156271 RepID=UPI003512BFD1